MGGFFFGAYARLVVTYVTCCPYGGGGERVRIVSHVCSKHRMNNTSAANDKVEAPMRMRAWPLVS